MPSCIEAMATFSISFQLGVGVGSIIAGGLADLFGFHAELLDHLGNVDPDVFHRVEHVDASATDTVVHAIGTDQLHQIFV